MLTIGQRRAGGVGPLAIGFRQRLSITAVQCHRDMRNICGNANIKAWDGIVR